jgi:isoleucyl-tRNA synthetase
VQAARKNAGLAVEDRIELSLVGDDDLLAAVRAHESYVTTETLATTLSYDGTLGQPGGSVSIDGRTINIALARAGPPA